jgi:hypothetical protein
MRSRDKIEPGLLWRRRFLDLHRCHQPVAKAVNGLDDRLPIIAQHLAKPADRLRQHRVGKDASRPHRLAQFILGHNFARVKQQIAQHAQRLGLEFDDLACNPDIQSTLVKFDGRKAPAAIDPRNDQRLRLLLSRCQSPFPRTAAFLPGIR